MCFPQTIRSSRGGTRVMGAWECLLIKASALRSVRLFRGPSSVPCITCLICPAEAGTPSSSWVSSTPIYQRWIKPQGCSFFNQLCVVMSVVYVNKECELFLCVACTQIYLLIWQKMHNFVSSSGLLTASGVLLKLQIELFQLCIPLHRQSDWVRCIMGDHSPFFLFCLIM